MHRDLRHIGSWLRLPRAANSGATQHSPRKPRLCEEKIPRTHGVPVPEELSITICAGMPSLPGYTVDSGKFPYPDTTIDVAKVIAAHGITVSYEHDRENRQYASLNAADIWLPILQVTHELLIALGAHVLAEIIMGTLGSERANNGQLHFEYRVTDREGELQYLKIDGKGEDVLTAITLFGKRMIE